MQEIFIQFIFLILVILALVMLANKVHIAYPIILVLGGLILSFTSHLFDISIDPDLVFFIFLPPILYEAAWQTSWKQFWKFRRVITSFAFPIVIITSCVVAVVSNWLIPGFTLALGFLLGGIISPPDAVSATTIMRQVNAPKSLVSVIEGESLLNDASSLIILRFALAAVVTGQFFIEKAAITFVLVIVMGVLIGLVIGYVFYAIHRWLPTTTSIEVVLTLLTPYCMYYAAEHFHYSGVLAVVSGGLLLSGKRQSMLSYKSRIQGINVWTSIIFVMNGLIFFLIGLQLPSIVQQMDGIGISKAITYGLLISLLLIITRLLCTLGASLFTRLMSNFITVADDNPGWKAPLVAGWAGMRGVISLAAALAIPVMISTNQPFPFRNLILFITFIVILVTLVLQGLTLPWLIRKLKLEDGPEAIPEEKQELIIQKKLALYSRKYLEEKHAGELSSNPQLINYGERLTMDVGYFSEELEANGTTGNTHLKKYRDILLELLQEQRSLLYKMNQHAEFDEALIRKYLSLVDIDEYRIREKQNSGAHTGDQ